MRKAQLVSFSGNPIDPCNLHGVHAGGTYITRSDVLRGQSWELSQADNSRSTRGGNVAASHVHKKRKLDDHTTKCVEYASCSAICSAKHTSADTCFLTTT